MNENGTLCIPLGNVSFADLATQTWKSALACYRHAAYDPREVDAEVEAVERLRGTAIDRRVLFNDLRSTDGWRQLPDVAHTEEALTDQRGTTTIDTVGERDKLAHKFCLYVRDLERHATIDLEVDTAFVASSTAEQMLRGVESLLIRAAQHTVRLDEAGSLTGIDPAERGPGWVRVDGAGRAPQQYVLCAAPPEHDGYAAWRAQPVLASGDGRAEPAR